MTITSIPPPITRIISRYAQNSAHAANKEKRSEEEAIKRRVNGNVNSDFLICKLLNKALLRLQPEIFPSVVHDSRF